jgi:peptidyl-prolyl cis-trans isomerase SurA
MIVRGRQCNQRLGLGLWFGILSAIGFLAAGPAAADPQGLQGVIAVVNDEMISNYDLEKRVSLVLAATGGQVPPEQREALQQQALQSLIDEKLELQEAKNFKVPISDEEVEETFARIGQQYNFTPAKFKTYLEGLGTTKEALTNQIRAELAWSSLVRGRLRSQITISDEEVETVLKRLEESVGQNEYKVSQIFLLADTPEKERDVLKTARQLVTQIKSGASFAQVAHQFSAGATAAVGGDMGWLPESQLSPELAKVLKQMKDGAVSDPVKSAGGYYIVELNGKRKTLTADPMDKRFSLYQMFFKYPDGATDAAKADLKAKIAVQSAKITTCEGIADKAKAMGAAEQSDLGALRLGDLSAGLQGLVGKMEVGHVTAPLEAKDGFRLLAVCAVQAPEVTMPTAETVMNSLSQQRLSMMARRYLRDLRRDAIIEMRH